jgi:hypothetical protein
MEAPDGTPMCRCDSRRANWYLKRDIAYVVSEDPFVFRLKFQPNGIGSANDQYGLAEKENRCVVCGTYDNLTKHHIVPYMYRKHLPVEIKSRSSHDVVIICDECHEQYEETAMILKNDINVEITGDRIRQIVVPESRDKVHIARYCRTLHNNRDRIPLHRQEEMTKEISQYFGKEATPDFIAAFVSEFDYSSPYHYAAYDPGKIAIERLKTPEEIKNFVVMWRQHFLDNAQPKYMVEHWDVNRDLVRTS